VLANLSGQSPEEQVKGTTKAFLAWLLPDNRKTLNDGTGTTTHYAFGHTKVYFTSFVLETLEAARNKAVYNHVCAMQKIGRGFVQRKKYKRMIIAVRLIRKMMKIFHAKAKLRKIRGALVLIQSIAAMRYIRKRYTVQRDLFRKDSDLKKAQVYLFSVITLS
jgi:myosin heavy subunit